MTPGLPEVSASGECSMLSAGVGTIIGGVRAMVGRVE
jgi:hypothetical protein